MRNSQKIQWCTAWTIIFESSCIVFENVICRLRETGGEKAFTRFQFWMNEVKSQLLNPQSNISENLLKKGWKKIKEGFWTFLRPESHWEGLELVNGTPAVLKDDETVLRLAQGWLTTANCLALIRTWIIYFLHGRQCVNWSFSRRWAGEENSKLGKWVLPTEETKVITRFEAWCCT